MPSSNKITVYIGTYTRRESFVDGKAAGIYIYHLDLGSGELTYAATVTGAGTVNPSFLTLAPDQRCLYAVNELYGTEGTHGSVSAFAIDPVTKHLTFLNQQSTQGLAPCYTSIEPEGRYCLVANYETGSVCVLPIQGDGSLGEATDTVQFSGSGPTAGRQDGPHAHMVVSSPDCNAGATGSPQRTHRFILVVDLGTDRLRAFELDSEQGVLNSVDSLSTHLPPGTGPRHLAFHPQRPFVYMVSELQSEVVVLRYVEQDCTFEAVQTISTLPDGFTGSNLGAEIRVSPSGHFVYASNRGHDSMAIFAVDQESGELSVVGHESTTGHWPARIRDRSIRRPASGGKPGFGHSGHVLDQSSFWDADRNWTCGQSANTGLPPTVCNGRIATFGERITIPRNFPVN